MSEHDDNDILDDDNEIDDINEEEEKDKELDIAPDLPDATKETEVDQEDIGIDEEINDIFREKDDINKMTFVDAYVKYSGQLVICITGLSGSGKTKLAHDMARDLKLYYINAHNYGVENNEKIILTKKDEEGKIVDSLEVINYDTDKAFDWDKLNDDINKRKSIGVIVTGIGLPTDKIKSQVDFHIHLKISKQLCMELRRKYIMEHKKKFPKEVIMIEKGLDSQLLNRFTYPYYLDLRGRSKIDAWISVDETKEVYDKAFDLLMDFFEKYLRKI